MTSIMKKPLQTIIFFLLLSPLIGQVETIKVRRFDSIACDYKFIVTNDLADKMLRLSMYQFASPDKLTKNTVYDIRSKLRYFIREKPFFINKFYFDSVFKDVCIVNKFHLTKVEIKSYEDTNHFQIKMTYKKIKK